MLWTVFTFLMVVWALALVFHFRGAIIPLMLVLALAVLFLTLVVRRNVLQLEPSQLKRLNKLP